MSSRVLAANAQARAKAEKDISKEGGSYVTDPWWLTGLILQIIGAIFDFAALGFAPQSVVAPLGSLTLVVNVLLAPIMQKEKPPIKTVIATSVIITGSVITVLFSAREDSVDKVNDVFALYERWEFLLYAILVCTMMFVFWLTVQYMVYLSRHHVRSYNKKYYKLHRFCIASLRYGILIYCLILILI